jgi:ElaB/YqjD/DUF883 family membrane-anchored ribosome-binding protein
MDQDQRSAAEIGRRAAEEVLGIGRQGARHLGNRLRDAAQTLIHEQKDRAADAVEGLAQALREAADQLEREEKPTAAGYADQAAARVAQFSATVRARDIEELLLEVESFARRQPTLFFAGALAAGFLLGRVLSRQSEPVGNGSAGSMRHEVAGYAMTGGERAVHTPVSPAAEAAMADDGPATRAGPG